MKKLFLFSVLSVATIAGAQNVGIGISNPSRAKFEVHGVAGNGATSALFGGDGHGISLMRSWPTIGFNIYNNSGNNRYMASGFGATQYLDPGNGGLYFDLYANGSVGTSTFGTVRALSLFSNGNVGIAGAGNYGTLTVPRGTAFDGTAVFFGTQWTSHFNYSSSEHTYIRAGKNGGRVYLNDIVGGKVQVGQHHGTTKFGINAFDPMYTLEVVQANNTGMVLINPDWGWKAWELRSDKYNSDPNAPQTCLSLYYNGRSNPIMGWFRPTDGGYSSNSDARLKTDIETLEPLLDKIMKLRPARYRMKGAADGGFSIGLIAQEARQFFPEMVSESVTSEKDGGLPRQLGIDYGSFSIVAIKAIQEQQALIDAQQKKIEALEKKLDEVLRRLQ